ncbi:PEX5-related protein isoform X2 [Electrophorus electricus]|uniref:PEX5-related protein isoform X2 n=1 Tax=Electrophorus electricus TaxID=8005 RepID=UPI000F0A700A|nr:PEX5-related protein isoform X2 [Electrophorus electricus]
MYQGHLQGKDSRAADKSVAMVLKEIPNKASPEGKPLLTVTNKLVSEQQESRPLLSPSIDDFLCETKCDRAARPVTSNTAVLSSSLDLLDLSDPGDKRNGKDRKSPVSIRSTPHRKKRDETELIQVDIEHNTSCSHTPVKESLDSAVVPSPLEKWEELTLHPDRIGNRKWKQEKRRSSKTSGDFVWSIDSKTHPESDTKTSLEVNYKREAETTAQGQVRTDRRWGSMLLSRNQSLEEEYERAKAAVESDTEFWDKMEAEWEELARRNWLTENEEAQFPPTVSPLEKGYYFHTDNPYKDWPNAFEEGLRKAREGDLPNAVLLLEAAILQDPQDSEAWQVLGTTQAENENEQAAIVSLQRCLELHPNNLQALMALAVSMTNTGMKQEACEALLGWLKHNQKYKHLLKNCTHLHSSPGHHRLSHASPDACPLLPEVKELYVEAAQENPDRIDPDLQTGLGVMYNLSSEFNKAVEAFNAALSVRPEDYLLWNRLGATLANGDRSEEAVEAYTRALELQPGFIRSRYNLGISCINLGAHREAASNFLTALGLQRKSSSRQLSHQVMSGNIWAALRIALSNMDQPELFQAANIGDLDLLMRAFNLDM